MSKQISFKLEELAKLINGEVVGDSNAVVDNLSTIQNANSSSVTFLSNAKYIDHEDYNAVSYTHLTLPTNREV